ncbi:MAG: divalent-cation tolerance protein CutA [Candidatus Heimdallarchaeota archaeon]
MVLATCPINISEDLASKIVGKRLVACVNVVKKVKSFYWWQGNLENEMEAILLMKTRADLFHQLQEFFLSIHPYDNPEIIALPIIKGSSQYLEWVKLETTREE